LSNQVIDEVDLRILHYLLKDATQPYRVIGQLVHLTGQAVGSRVRKLQDLGVIEGYTLRWNPEKIGQAVHAFVTVFMKSSTAHQSFQSFVQHNDQVAETHRVSGEGCYWMRVRVGTLLELNAFLDELLKYGNYKASLSIVQVK
jgi:Lrp/AsnC family leucine-responsive transcriptional regulator